MRFKSGNSVCENCADFAGLNFAAGKINIERLRNVFGSESFLTWIIIENMNVLKKLGSLKCVES